MPNGQASTNTPDAWDHILHEARVVRNKQDDRLARVQRQSQLLVTGFLAVIAILFTGASVYLTSQPQVAAQTAAETKATEADNDETDATEVTKDGFDVTRALSTEVLLLAACAVVLVTAAGTNARVWLDVHRAARQWDETVSIDGLVQLAQSPNAVLDLQHHLVQTLATQFGNNEKILQDVQDRFERQALMTFILLYLLYVLLVVYVLFT